MMLEFENWFHVSQLTTSGIGQMSLDEALLAWLMEYQTQPTLITRTYIWDELTWSLGVHQKTGAPDKNHPVVRRPTGGRAILHGEDVSFAFVTNHPAVLKMTLNDSYCLFTKWVKEALFQLNVPLAMACEPNTRAYTLSALCFETKTPSDLVTESGDKVAGSAQLRRQGGILQHGAAFLKPFNIQAINFDKALTQVISGDLKQAPKLLTPENIDALNIIWKNLKTDYQQEAIALS